ncbi:MAG: hypothetical protein JWO84_154 [Parcubacteria group bacterium]|nr:hypothetical protein [Parcubacteria group bacterium]
MPRPRWDLNDEECLRAFAKLFEGGMGTGLMARALRARWDGVTKNVLGSSIGKGKVLRPKLEALWGKEKTAEEFAAFHLRSPHKGNRSVLPPSVRAFTRASPPPKALQVVHVQDDVDRFLELAYEGMANLRSPFRCVGTAADGSPCTRMRKRGGGYCELCGQGLYAASAQKKTANTQARG